MVSVMNLSMLCYPSHLRCSCDLQAGIGCRHATYFPSNHPVISEIARYTEGRTARTHLDIVPEVAHGSISKYHIRPPLSYRIATLGLGEFSK